MRRSSVDALAAAIGLLVAACGSNSTATMLATPTVTVATTPTATPPASPIPSARGYDAVYLRAGAGDPAASIDIVVVRPDGRERIARHLTTDGLPAGTRFSYSTADTESPMYFGSLSQDGWIAVETQEGSGDAGTPVPTRSAWALFDLAEPEQQPRLVPSTGVIGGAWGGRHLFATGTSVLSVVQITDAGSGTTTMLTGNLPGGGPDLIWAADGSGLLVRLQDGYAISPVGGGPTTKRIPELAFRGGPRFVAAGGRTVSRCDADTCTSTGGAASVQDPTGRNTVWYSGELMPARLVDTGFSADGRSLWLLLDRVDGSRHTALIARADAPGAARVIATVDLGKDLYHMWFDAFAPDDSTIAIGHWTGSESHTVIEPSILVRTPDAAIGAPSGNLAGFVPAAVTDAWPGGGSWAPAPSASRP